MNYPSKIANWIGGKEVVGPGASFANKYNPATGAVLASVVQVTAKEIKKALGFAEKSFQNWSAMPVIKRADILREVVMKMRERKKELASIVSLESGKSLKSSLAEVEAAIECGFFFAGEGRRYYGEVLTSSNPNREVKIIRQSMGIGFLVTPFNNPAAGIAWKIFPALLCGNAVILKSHRYTPYVGIWFAKIFKEAGLPDGVLQVLQGSGEKIGALLSPHPSTKFISFTGSVNVGRKILKAAADNFTKVSIESGGKNPFVVCNDADLEKAADLAVSSAFVDAGQRCAAASRILVFDKVYDDFKKVFLQKIKKMKIGVTDKDDFGAIISAERLRDILAEVENSIKQGAKLLTGGKRIRGSRYGKGYFMEPTVVESNNFKSDIACKELFGPVVVLSRVKNLKDALRVVNGISLKLTGSIHTKSMSKAREFTEMYRAGVVRVNGPTHGSEPHMPFGGLGLSGNGWREPGTKALDFYSEWKQISCDY